MKKAAHLPILCLLKSVIFANLLLNFFRASSKMKNVSFLLILTFAAVGVSSYYIDYYQDLNEASSERSEYWSDDDYSNSLYDSPREMSDENVRNIYDYGDSNEEVPTGKVAHGTDFVEGYRYSQLGYPQRKVVQGETYVPGINGGCSSDKYLCQYNNECIYKMAVCDGEIDCKDGQDETGCPNTYPTPTSEPILYGGCLSWDFLCRKDGICIDSGHRCDGTWHCSDGEDEYFCSSIIPVLPSTRTTTSPSTPPTTPRPPPPPSTSTPRPTPTTPQPRGCSSKEFYCKMDGKCIPLSYKCNEKWNCSDGEDEQLCTTTTSRPRSNECRSYERRCYGYCLGFWMKCESLVG